MTLPTPPQHQDPPFRGGRDSGSAPSLNPAAPSRPDRSGAGKTIVILLGALVGIGTYEGLNALENDPRGAGFEIIFNALIGLLLAIGLPLIAGVRRARRWWPRIGLLVVLLLLTAPLATCSFLFYVGGQWGR